MANSPALALQESIEPETLRSQSFTLARPSAFNGVTEALKRFVRGADMIGRLGCLSYSLCKVGRGAVEQPSGDGAEEPPRGGYRCGKVLEFVDLCSDAFFLLHDMNTNSTRQQAGHQVERSREGQELRNWRAIERRPDP